MWIPMAFEKWSSEGRELTGAEGGSWTPTGRPIPARNRIAEATLPLRNRAVMPFAALIPPDVIARKLSLGSQCRRSASFFKCKCGCNGGLIRVSCAPGSELRDAFRRTRLAPVSKRSFARGLRELCFMLGLSTFDFHARFAGALFHVRFKWALFCSALIILYIVGSRIQWVNSSISTILHPFRMNFVTNFGK